MQFVELSQPIKFDAAEAEMMAEFEYYNVELIVYVEHKAIIEIMFAPLGAPRQIYSIKQIGGCAARLFRAWPEMSRGEIRSHHTYVMGAWQRITSRYAGRREHYGL